MLYYPRAHCHQVSTFTKIITKNSSWITLNDLFHSFCKSCQLQRQLLLSHERKSNNNSGNVLQIKVQFTYILMNNLNGLESTKRSNRLQVDHRVLLMICWWTLNKLNKHEIPSPIVSKHKDKAIQFICHFEALFTQ